MKLASNFCLLCFCVVFLCSCSETPTLRPLSTGDVVLAFGDSLTYGTGAGKAESYPSILEDMIGYRVVNAGIPGEVSGNGLKRFPGVLDDTQPALVILIHGGNDLLRRRSSASMAGNLLAMIDIAQSRGIDVVMLGVPKPGLILSAHDEYEKIAAMTGIPSDLDIIGDVLQFPANKSDAVHPNAKGYRLMAEAVTELLQDHGALP